MNIQVKSSFVSMSMRIPFEKRERFGVSLQENSEYTHQEDDIYHIANLSLEEIPQAISEFNTKHRTAFTASDFYFNETRFLSINQNPVNTMEAEKTPRNPIRTKADLNDLARKAADHQKRLRLYGQAFLMFWGFGVFFTALFSASQPENNDFARDFEFLALFGLLVGSFGFACFYNDNKNN